MIVSDKKFSINYWWGRTRGLWNTSSNCYQFSQICCL